MMVLITTVGRVLGSERHRRQERKLPPAEPDVGELAALREALDDLGTRLQRLEEERDFYRDLLESPEARRELRLGEGQGDNQG